MTCAACAGRIERVLKRVPGVAAANVNLATETAQVDGDARLTPAAIEAAIAKAGYGTRPVDHSGVPEDQSKLQRELISILIGAVLTLPLIAPMVVGSRRRSPHAVGLVAACAGDSGAILAGRDVLSGCVESAARRHREHGRAGGARHQRGLRAQPLSDDAAAASHLYFESAAVIIVLVRLGKWLEARAKRRTLKALEALESLRPTEALVRRDGRT